MSWRAIIIGLLAGLLSASLMLAFEGRPFIVYRGNLPESIAEQVMDDEVGKQHRPSSSAPPEPFELPWEQVTEGVIINLGPNIDPVMPHARQVTIAVEANPWVCTKLQEKALRGPNLHVVCAAVASQNGLATLHAYNKLGVSSSLAKPAPGKDWKGQDQSLGKWDFTAKGQRSSYIVPTITFKDVLERVPANISIPFAKTDMQGFDLTALRSAGDLLKRVWVVKSEVNGEGGASYEGTDNDYNDFVVLLEQRLGFEHLSSERPKEFWEQEQHRKRLSEGDACWWQPKMSNNRTLAMTYCGR